MAFNGWPAQAVEFYDGLEEDNSREYWHAHKAVYSEAVLRPMEELLEELSGRFGAGRIFRPNRDVMFSANKFQAGQTELPKEAGILKQIKFEVKKP